MDPVEPRERPPAFAHASEAELARILDFYEVRWAYEPDTFPIGWSLEGDVIESFSPDFYLADLDLYVELTTLKQTLVRRKNRKLRRLRELYPDVRIKLFYARDFRMLLLKFGRLALVDELTGSTGQSTPPRALSVPIAIDGVDGVVFAAAALGVPLPVGPAVPAGVAGEHDAGALPLARGRRRGRRRRHAAAQPGADAQVAGAAADLPGTP
jgi:hypothetical protein